MLIRFTFLWVLILAASSQQASAPEIPPALVKQWNLITYNTEFNAPVNDKNFYNPENVVVTGLAVTPDRIFIATPRLFSGVPATVSTVPRGQFGDSPDLQAYPDWSFHTTSLGSYNCSDLGLVSVYRLRVDSCNRLWALDAGVSRSLEDYEITCPPKILIFDLATNQVVRRIDFPREVRRGETLFTNLIIDETTSKPENKCDDVFVYISDTVEPAIVVYDSGRDLTWRLSHPSMFPDPDFAESRIGEDRFTLLDGVVGLAFDPKAGLVYFQPLATDRLFSISTEALRAGPFPRNQAIPVRLVGRKSSQGIGLAVSPLDGSIFFSPITETAVASWNPISNEQRVIAYDTQQLQFVADMSLAPDDPSGVYVVSSKFQRFFLKNLNANEVNTRILRIEIPRGIPQVSSSSFAPFGHHHGHRNGHHHRHYLPATRSAGPYIFPTSNLQSASPVFPLETSNLYSKAAASSFVGLNAGERFPQSTTGFPSTSYASFHQPSIGTSYNNVHFFKRA